MALARELFEQDLATALKEADAFVKENTGR